MIEVFSFAIEGRITISSRHNFTNTCAPEIIPDTSLLDGLSPDETLDGLGKVDRPGRFPPEVTLGPRMDCEAICLYLQHRSQVSNRKHETAKLSHQSLVWPATTV